VGLDESSEFAPLIKSEHSSKIVQIGVTKGQQFKTFILAEAKKLSKWDQFLDGKSGGRCQLWPGRRLHLPEAQRNITAASSGSFLVSGGDAPEGEQP